MEPTPEIPKANPYKPQRAHGQGLEFPLPAHALPWPDSMKPPSFNVGSDFRRVPLDDGLYYRNDPSGRLQFMAIVYGGRLSRWLVLDPQGGAFYRSPWGAQRYYGNGLMEDFSRDDDTSPPYASKISLSKWARPYLKSMAEEPPPQPKPKPELAPSKGDPGEEAPAHSERILSVEGEPPADLEQRLQKLGQTRWDDARHCYQELVQKFDWEPGLARDFCNFAPAACAWALSGDNARLDQDFFLYSAWETPAEPGVARLDCIPLYRRVRQLALASADGKDPLHWVSGVARVNPVRLGEGTLSRPIVWTLPPKNLCGFWMTMVSVDLLLRQEASRHIELSYYLAGADQERLLRAAALVGAFLQAARCSGATSFQPDRLPWLGGADWLSRAEELADLIANLDDRPLLLPPRKPEPRTPLVTALGSWVEGRRGSTSDSRGVEARPAWQQLGRFINERGDSLHSRLTALQNGRLVFDTRQPVGWKVQQHKFEGWSAEIERERFRQRALEAASGMNLATLLAGFDEERFALRFEAACFAVARAPRQDLSKQHRPLLAELEPILKERKHLSAEQVSQLTLALGVPLGAVGRGTTRLIVAALWVLSQWDAVALAVGLAQRMLSAL